MQNIMPDDLLNRRKFLSDSARLLVMLSSFSTLACACTKEKEKQSQLDGLLIEQGKIVLDLGEIRYHMLNTIGNGVRIEVNQQEKPLLVIRVSETQVAAISSQCTHAGYEVLLPEEGKLVCSSGHGGSFDLEGRVLSEPPKSNLQSYPAQLVANRVHIAYPLR